MTPLTQLEAMFADMRAHAPWDIDVPLLWGYFFTAADVTTLAHAARRLAADGHPLVES